MLFLTYWELNENTPVEERQAAARHLVDSGAFPPENVRVLRWDAAPDGWGILLAEAESASDYFRALNVWRAAQPGFFKCTKTAPALPVEEAIANTQEMLEAMDATGAAA